MPEIASLLTDVPPFDKLEFSCFGSDQFRSRLKSLPGNRNTVLLCGMEAHICVMQTALGALNEGYLVHVASDAVGSRAEWNWKIGLERMKAAGAVISSTEMMMYELLRCSGTPQFKELLPVSEITRQTCRVRVPTHSRSFELCGPDDFTRACGAICTYSLRRPGPPRARHFRQRALDTSRSRRTHSAADTSRNP